MRGVVVPRPDRCTQPRTRASAAGDGGGGGSMKQAAGNLRPPPAMSGASPITLPSARIHCDSNHIRVGDRSFVSASDALCAYMQQFDGRPPPPGNSSLHALSHRTALGAASRGNPDPANSSLHALGHRPAPGATSRGNPDPANSSLHALGHRPAPGATSRGNPDPANVTGLLTGSPRSADVTAASFNGVSSAGSSRPLNGEGYPAQSSKHSVSFALPDSSQQYAQHSASFALPDSSQQYSQHSASLPVEERAQALSSPRHPLSASVYGGQEPRSPRTGQHLSSHGPALTTLGLAHASLPHHTPATSASLPHHTPATSHVYGNSHSQSNGLAENGLSESSRLPPGAGFGEGGEAGAPRVGGQRARSEVEVLLSAGPGQREVQAQAQAQAARRQVQLQRLLTDSTHSSSTSSNKSCLQQEGECNKRVSATRG